jgi:hypothetical protein
MNEPSDKLAELVFFALDHGIDSVRDGGPLVAFLLTEGCGRHLARFATERIEQGVMEARRAVSSLDGSVNSYAIAYDGYVTIEGTRFDAILVEAAERGSAAGFLFAQRYRPKKGLLRRFKVIGNAIFLEEAEQRFR